MKEINKKSADYIQELEDKVVDLSLQLKGKNSKLKTTQLENYERILKLVHNLKNPMGVAFSFSEILTNDGKNLPTEKFEKYIEAIKKSANFSIQTLNSIASLNRLNSPEFKLNYQQVDYVNLLNTVIKTFQTAAENRQITIATNVPKEPLFLTLDTTEITKVIRILIDNALRYSSNNSTINITVQENEHTIETIISDEGIGISEENLHTIFNEFFVVNTYSEDKQKCIGLGLTIAKNSIQFHNGKISAKSNLGSGSTFTFVLPKK